MPKLQIFLFSILFSSHFTWAQQNQTTPSNLDVTLFVESYMEMFYPDSNIKELLFVSIKHQKLYLIRYNHVVSSYSVSTSMFGIGNKMQSQKTPLGLHQIKNKIGYGVPFNGIIKGGSYTGENAVIIPGANKSKADNITTRILWLSGLEEGKNKGGIFDTYLRGIYIHGTDEEGLIGTPASHGCIRMTNYDVLELFELVEVGLHVLILDV